MLYLWPDFEKDILWAHGSLDLSGNVRLADLQKDEKFIVGNEFGSVMQWQMHFQLQPYLTFGLVISKL